MGREVVAGTRLLVWGPEGPRKLVAASTSPDARDPFLQGENWESAGPRRCVPTRPWAPEGPGRDGSTLVAVCAR